MRNNSAFAAPILGLLFALPFASVAGVVDRSQIRPGNPTFASMDGGQLEGEHIDTRTLTVFWETTDLVVPGTAGMDVAVSRSMGKSSLRFAGALASWDLEVPRIEVPTMPSPIIQSDYSGGNVCTNPSRQAPDQAMGISYIYFDPDFGYDWVWAKFEDYHAPMVLQIPNQPARNLLPKNVSLSQFPADVQYVSTDNWIVRCSEDGKRFLVTSPAGIRYDIGVPIYSVSGDTFNGYYGGWRVYGASIVQDDKGNSQTYVYADGGLQPVAIVTKESAYARRLIRIDSNGSPQVSFQYYPVSSAPSSGLLESFTFDGKTWSFEYQSASQYGFTSRWLSRVNLPEGLAWNYEFTPFPGSTSHQAVTTPSGAKVTYLSSIPHVQSKYGRLNLTRTVSGESMPALTWEYRRNIAGTREIVDVTTPHSKEQYVFTRGWYGNFEDVWILGVPTAQLLETHTIWSLNDEFAKTTVYEYTQLPLLWGARPIGWPGTYYSNQNRPTPVSKTTTYVGTPAKAYVTEWSNFDEYASWRTMQESGDASRETTATYYSSMSPWIVGKPATTTVTGEGTVSNEYYPDGSLKKVDKYGLVENFEYHSTGDLSRKWWIKDGVVQDIDYTDYYRGKARRVDYPGGVYVTAGINPSGTVAWVNDPMRQVTHFDYDNLNRLTKITPPIHSPTDFVWTTPTELVTTRGPYRKVTTVDQLLRPILTQESDTGNPLSGVKFVRSVYGSDGHLSFTSFVSVSSTEERGLSFEYDSLGRKTKITDTSDNSYKSICYFCLPVSESDPTAANVEHITDERLFTVTNYFRSYGSPDQRDLVKVKQQVTPSSEGNHFITTDIQRSKLGAILGVNQGGVDRTYTYYPSKLLWKITEPETGVTEFTYDEVGNRKTSKVGSSGTTTYNYDSLNQLVGIDYPGATPDVTQDFYANGQLKYTFNSSARWDYFYDEVGSLKTETMTSGTRTYQLTYDYNGNDSLSNVHYPSGTNIAFNPDAFGRATTAGIYASNITYHPNGFMKSLTYGNGQAMSFTLDAKNQPDALTVRKGAITRVSLNYNFDPTGNVSSIADYVDGQNSRVLRYDGMSRLTGADGPWGVGSISYDDVGNISTMNLGSLSQSYAYHATTKRLSSTTGRSNYVMGYDNYGNISSNGSYSFVFNDAGHLTSVPTVPGLQYKYDPHGKRMYSTASGGSIYSLYNLAGQLLYSDDVSAGKTTEYIYAGSNLVAKRDFGSGIVPDFDGDGIPDKIETQLGLSSSNASDGAGDIDGDGLSNAAEYAAGTELTLSDSDNDGMSDGYEARYGLNPLSADGSYDADNDGLTNLQEFQLNTDPRRADTDGDGIPDNLDPKPRFNPAIIPIIEFLLNN